MVSADATAVRQVVLNLLLNAVAAPSPIQSTVRVTVHFRDGALEVRVIDDGPGLPDHIAALINEKGEVRVLRGAGLGIWTAMFLTRRMAGTLRQAPQSRGTCLVLTLPCEEVQDAVLAA